MELEAARLLAAGLCMGLVEAMGRNPEMSDKLFSNMIVSMAITESTGIYSLVIALIILFVM